MGFGDILPVVAGLAIGIGLVVLFSVMHKPDFMLTDEELVSKYGKLGEVKYFLEKFPDARTEVNRNPNDDNLEISFIIEKRIYPASGFDAGIHSLTVSVLARPYQSTLSISCGLGGVSTSGELENTDEIDFAEQWCFQTAATEKQLTIAVNAVNGRYLGLREAIVVEPRVIAEFPLLQNMIAEAEKAGTEELVIVYRNVSLSEAELLLKERGLAFTRTCLELVCYDERSSFIRFGNDVSYMIRMFEGNDPFGIENGGMTGVFVPDTSEDEVNDRMLVSEGNDEATNIEIEYNEN